MIIVESQLKFFNSRVSLTDKKWFLLVREETNGITTLYL